ncbi:hypothetical protein [Spirosoma profusum]|nr:hypothetical protein [Spirosoma profusum]
MTSTLRKLRGAISPSDLPVPRPQTAYSSLAPTSIERICGLL